MSRMKTTQTWNQHVVKKENKTLVLETIKNNNPISRADIANMTGLNKGTVSSLVSELIDEKLINESGPGKSKGGRRPVMLLFNEVAGYTVGIDLGVNYILGILTDLEGNICQETAISFQDLSYQEIQDKLFQIIDTLIASAPSSPYGIIGIGMGVPGTVNLHGEILLAPNLKWKNVHIKSILEEKYHVPVIIENEANAGAYGEKKFGAGKKYNHIIYVSVGIGLGVGLILNGQLYKGNNGFSGELGHMTIEMNGKECRCGNLGCWELYASEQYLYETASKLNFPIPPSETISLNTLIALAKKGNKDTIHLFETLGDNLGIGLTNIVNIFNPEQIIIGNRITAAKEWIQEPINHRMNRALTFQQKDLKIDFSSLSKHSSALGVAAFSVENFFNGYLKQV